MQGTLHMSRLAIVIRQVALAFATPLNCSGAGVLSNQTKHCDTMLLYICITGSTRCHVTSKGVRKTNFWRLLGSKCIKGQRPAAIFNCFFCLPCPTLTASQFKEPTGIHHVEEHGRHGPTTELVDSAVGTLFELSRLDNGQMI